jgi:hypothetical protein
MDGGGSWLFLAPKIFFISELLLGGSDRIEFLPGWDGGPIGLPGNRISRSNYNELGDEIGSEGEDEVRSCLVFPRKFLWCFRSSTSQLNSTRFLCFTSKFATNERSSRRRIMLPLLN